MKIVFLGDAAAHHLRRWSKYFADQGHEVHIITFNPDYLDGYEPIRIHIIKKRFLGSSLINRFLNIIPMFTDFNNLIKNINPDIIHSHSAASYAWLAMLTRFHPLIITPWGRDILIDIQISKVSKILTKLALNKSDLVTCDGINTKEVMVNLGVDSEKIILNTYGVNINKFKSCSEDNHIREKYSWLNSNIVISTRTLNPVHNVETFIMAIPLVLKTHPDTKFIIIGHGSEQDNLMNLSRSLNIFNSIQFPGKIEEEEMISCLQTSDIYISTSLSESGLSASTAEAMACELPVINTDTGDITLWIKDGEGGFIIPTKNPEILAERILYLLNHSEERIKYGKRNRKVIEERNNHFIEMKKMENIYLNLAKK